jgi:hydroxypyruvate isomerase
MLKFNPNLRFLFTELPMIERYAESARCGFKGVEVAFPYEFPAAQIAKILADNDLKFVQILSPVNWEIGERGIACLPGREADFRESMRIAVDYSAQVGRPNVHVLAGLIPQGVTRERCHAIFLENLAWAADLAKTERLTVIIEPVSRHYVEGFLYTRLDEGIAIIKAIGRDNVKLCYDTYHVQVEEGSLTERLEAAYPYIGHMQIGNAPGRNEPGVGEIHFPYIFEQIERLGWDGWIGCEYLPARDSWSSLETWGAPFGYGAKAPALSAQ